MRSFRDKAAFVLFFALFQWYISFAQIFDFNSEIPYKKVFVDTDDFDATYLDVLEKGYSKIQVDSIQFSVLNDLAYYWHTRNLEKALRFTKIGLTLTANCENPLWLGKFQVTQAAILLRMENLDSAQIILESAMKKLLERELPLLTTQMGYVYERRGQLNKAADYALKTLDLGAKYDNKWAMAMAYSDLSNLFWKQSKFEAGLEYGLKSLAIFEERGIQNLDYDFTLYVVGNNYLELRDYTNAMAYYNRCISLGEKYGFYNNLSDAYISLADLNTDLEVFDYAEESGKKALEYAHLLKNDFMVMRSWLSLGKLYNRKKSYDAAITSLNQCIATASDDFGDEFYLSQAYAELSKAYGANGEYKKAYNAFAKYDTLQRMVFTAESDNRISRLRTEFDVEAKEDTILSQQTQIQKHRTRQILISIIAILLLVLVGLFYKAIQNKLKINRLLAKQNTEKEFLLKEIHHRVKNNLEVVSSLLSLQSAEFTNRDLLNAMQQSKNRVRSMSIIHQKLYVGENLAAVEMKDYFLNLGEYIIDSYGAEQRVLLNVDMPAIELNVDLAIPIGLIVNELITNSLKYAFPNGNSGQITISLLKKQEGLHLQVSDNGIGQREVGSKKSTGFGTRLVHILTKQLEGKMELNTISGTSVHIEFQTSKAA